MTDPADSAPADLRASSARVRVVAPAALLDRVLGPLAALRDDAATSHDVLAVAERGPDPRLPAIFDREPGVMTMQERGSDGRWGAVGFTSGYGSARIPRQGPITLEGAFHAPEGDAYAERVTIPALAEALRRRGVRLVHAAVLLDGRDRRAWLVPAARGGGKTTLSLSLRGRGFSMLSDDRAFLAGPPDAPTVDAWPEPPRVGDRSLFLLPPGVRAGPRDERTGKALVPSLRPPRLPAPVRVAGVLLPRLVEGAGGVVRETGGARALAAFASQVVIATDPETASASLAWVAAALSALPLFEVDVGDDPERLARAVPSAAGTASR